MNDMNEEQTRYWMLGFEEGRKAVLREKGDVIVFGEEMLRLMDNRYERAKEDGY